MSSKLLHALSPATIPRYISSMPPSQIPSGSRYARVFRFVTHYWLLSPVMFSTLLAARIASSLVDVSVPLASGHFVDVIVSGSRDNPAPALWALAGLLGLVTLF